MNTDSRHFNQTPKRQAEFIKLPNMLKAKVGTGGLSDEILQKAQELLENNTVDFLPLAEMYLDSLMKGVEMAKSSGPDQDGEYIIAAMLYPAVQIKANGGMFHYSLVTQIADRLIQFLEVIEAPDIESMEIVLAFHSTIRAVVLGKIVGDGGTHGKALLKALTSACSRYFEKHSSTL